MSDWMNAFSFHSLSPPPIINLLPLFLWYLIISHSFLNHCLGIYNTLSLEFSPPDICMWRKPLHIPQGPRLQEEIMWSSLLPSFIIPCHITQYLSFAVTVWKYLLVYLFTCFLLYFPQDGKMAGPKSCLSLAVKYLRWHVLCSSPSWWMYWINEHMDWHWVIFKVCSSLLGEIILITFQSQWPWLYRESLSGHHIHEKE